MSWAGPRRRRRRGRRRARRRDRDASRPAAWTPPPERHRCWCRRSCRRRRPSAAPRPRAPRRPRSLHTGASIVTSFSMIRGFSSPPSGRIVTRSVRVTVVPNGTSSLPSNCAHGCVPPSTGWLYSARLERPHQVAVLLELHHDPPALRVRLALEGDETVIGRRLREPERLAASGRLLVAVASRLVVPLPRHGVVVEDLARQERARRGAAERQRRAVQRAPRRCRRRGTRSSCRRSGGAATAAAGRPRRRWWRCAGSRPAARRRTCRPTRSRSGAEVEKPVPAGIADV